MQKLKIAIPKNSLRYNFLKSFKIKPWTFVGMFFWYFSTVLKQEFSKFFSFTYYGHWAILSQKSDTAATITKRKKYADLPEEPCLQPAIFQDCFASFFFKKFTFKSCFEILRFKVFSRTVIIGQLWFPKNHNSSLKKYFLTWFCTSCLSPRDLS